MEKLKINKQDKFLSEQETPVVVMVSENPGIADSIYRKNQFRFINKCIRFGMSYDEISKILGCTKQNVYYLNRYGLKRFTHSIKKGILERDKKMCRVCKRSTIKLHIHHIGKSRNHNEDNLITLCENCHRLYEGLNLKEINKMGKKLGITHLTNVKHL